MHFVDSSGNRKWQIDLIKNIFFILLHILTKKYRPVAAKTTAFMCCDTYTGHKIAPNTVANATKIIVLATKIQKSVAKLATRTL